MGIVWNEFNVIKSVLKKKACSHHDAELGETESFLLNICNKLNIATFINFI